MRDGNDLLALMPSNFRWKFSKFSLLVSLAILQLRNFAPRLVISSGQLRC
jgi:hypothetical protein